MKSLVISTLYPNSAQPQHGIFIEHRSRHLKASGRLEMEILAPVPWFPFGGATFGKYATYAKVPREEMRFGLRIHHPRYIVIPKIGMTITPLLLAAAMIGPIKKLIRDGFDFDVIDCYYFYPDGVAAALLARYFRKPYVVSALGTDINLIPQYALPRRMIQWAARNAASMSAVCKALKDRMVELGMNGGDVRVILHGVDLDLFRPPVDRAADRARFGMTGPTLISVGHLIERKGHHLIIEALAELEGVNLFIAGTGEMERELKQLAKDRQVAERVRFLGHVDQSELKSYFGAADALVLASSREGIANVLLEAMACGTPVVATRIWGTPEVITAPEAGVLVPERTAASIAASVRQLLATKIDRAATRRFVEYYSWDRTTSDHLAMFDHVLRGEASGGAVQAV